jgi:hypothetical protein
MLDRIVELRPQALCAAEAAAYRLGGTEVTKTWPRPGSRNCAMVASDDGAFAEADG